MRLSVHVEATLVRLINGAIANGRVCSIGEAIRQGLVEVLQRYYHGDLNVTAEIQRAAATTRYRRSKGSKVLRNGAPPEPKSKQPAARKKKGKVKK